MDEAFTRRLTTPRRIYARLQELTSNQRGRRQLMVWLDERLREGWPHSPLETIMNQIFNRYPLPKPTKQFTIYQDRQKIKRGDFAYPAWT